MKAKVLIIDDEEEIGNLLSAVLNSMGYKAEHRSSLQSGIKAFEAKRHDIVFLDLMLPDGDGFSIIPKIREGRYDTNIIIISAIATKEERQRASLMGIRNYLQKPFDKNQIEAAVRN